MFGFLDAPVGVAYHLVTSLATLVSPLFGTLSAAVVIVLFTACVRLLLHPLARAAVRGEKARAALAPRVRELREKHGTDRERLQRELVELHRAEGTSMFAGCLPMLLQIPFFSVTYRLFLSGTIGGAPNQLLRHTLFGAPLGTHFLDSFAGGALSPHVLVFLGLFAVLAAVAHFAVRWQSAQANASGEPAPPGAALLRLLPYGTILVAAVVPLAAGLYLVTTTTWTAVERAALRRDRAAARG